MLHSRSRSSGSLDDVMLEDDTELHTKELDDFFGSETEVSQQVLYQSYTVEETK